MSNPIKITVNVSYYDREMVNLLQIEEPVVSKHLITRAALRIGLEHLSEHPGSLRAAILKEREEARKDAIRHAKLISERDAEVQS